MSTKPTAIEIDQTLAAGSSHKTRSDMQGRSIWARCPWALIQAPKRWPHSDSSFRSKRTRSVARGESWNDAEMKPMHPADDVPSCHHITHRAFCVEHDVISHRGGDAHNITRNLEAEFNEAELLPKTKEVAIMAAAAYIAANTSNGDEHMCHLRNLALEGVRVLQGTNEQGHDITPRRNVPPVEQLRHQTAAPAVAPRPQVVEPINGELRHGLAQNRVDLAHAQHDARRFEDECELEKFGNSRHGLCERCDACQCFATKPHAPASELHTIPVA
jgi:hypothetical protein